MILKADWDKKKQRANAKKKNAELINNQIDSLRNAIFESHRILSDQGKYVTAELLYQELTRKAEKKLSFMDFYEDFLKRKKELVGVETTHEIYTKYSTVYSQ